jgi:hypothetical protein
MPWSAGCIINTSESKFWVHTALRGQLSRDVLSVMLRKLAAHALASPPQSNASIRGGDLSWLWVIRPATTRLVSNCLIT